MGSEENIVLELEGDLEVSWSKFLLKIKEKKWTDREWEESRTRVPMGTSSWEGQGKPYDGEEADLRLRIGPVKEPPHLSEHSGQSWWNAGTACGLAWLEQRTQWESSKRRDCRGWWGQMVKLLLHWQCLGVFVLPGWAVRLAKSMICVARTLSYPNTWQGLPGPKFWSCDTHIPAQF